MRLTTPGAVRRVPPHPVATPHLTVTLHLAVTPYRAVTKTAGGHR
ncbi:hypothetical protein OG462_32405 [Streptomyces sp. NBC_01077]|nr:hypothetical protein OG462_32405 [Streptomyces sp. NBC_01077]